MSLWNTSTSGMMKWFLGMLIPAKTLVCTGSQRWRVPTEIMSLMQCGWIKCEISSMFSDARVRIKGWAGARFFIGGRAVFVGGCSVSSHYLSTYSKFFTECIQNIFRSHQKRFERYILGYKNDYWMCFVFSFWHLKIFSTLE